MGWSPLRALRPNCAETPFQGFFHLAAERLDGFSPGTADKLRQASPHWMRHTHATHALAHRAELVTLRDNLWHASISTTSVDLHLDDMKRLRQMRDAFAGTSRSPGPSDAKGLSDVTNP